MNTVVLTVVMMIGVLIGWLYLWKPVPVCSSMGSSRPWRRLGAAICVVTAVMFVAGISLLDERSSPRLGLIYWGVISIMVLWVCLLAMKDMRYTYRVITQRRAEQSLGKNSNSPSSVKRETHG